MSCETGIENLTLFYSASVSSTGARIFADDIYVTRRYPKMVQTEIYRLRELSTKMENIKLQLNSTQIPNIILDEWQPLLTPAEFEVVLVIARQTYGWHKEADRISYSQLQSKTPYKADALVTAVKSLRASGKIIVTDEDGNQLHTKEECRGKSLYYKLNLGTIRNNRKVIYNYTENRNSKNRNTKETYTKEILSNKLDNDRSGFGNENVNRILEEFSDVTGLTKPSDQKPRQWAGNIARSKDFGVEKFRPCLTYLQNDLKLTITKLETVFRQFPLYQRDVLKISVKKLTKEQEEIASIYAHRN